MKLSEPALRFGAWPTPLMTCCWLPLVQTGQFAFGRTGVTGVFEHFQTILDLWKTRQHCTVFAGQHRFASYDPAQKSCKLGGAG